MSSSGRLMMPSVCKFVCVCVCVCLCWKCVYDCVSGTGNSFPPLLLPSSFLSLFPPFFTSPLYRYFYSVRIFKEASSLNIIDTHFFSLDISFLKRSLAKIKRRYVFVSLLVMCLYVFVCIYCIYLCALLVLLDCATPRPPHHTLLLMFESW